MLFTTLQINQSSSLRTKTLVLYDIRYQAIITINTPPESANTTQRNLIRIRRPKTSRSHSNDTDKDCPPGADSKESTSHLENSPTSAANSSSVLETSTLTCKQAIKRPFIASTIVKLFDDNITRHKKSTIARDSITLQLTQVPHDQYSMRNNMLSSNTLPITDKDSENVPDTPTRGDLIDKADSDMEINFQFADTSKSFSSQSSLPEISSSNIPSIDATPRWASDLQAQMNRIVALFEGSAKENLILRQELKLSNARIQLLEQKLSCTRSAGDFDFTVPKTFLRDLGSNASKYSDVINKDTRNQLSNNASHTSFAKQRTTAGPNTKDPHNKTELPKTSFADMAKKSVPFNNNRKRTTSKQRKVAARIFEAPAEQTSSDTFLYLYLPNKYRIRIKDFRQKLRTMGLDNGRILDIHYPARGVVALLIHQSYRVEMDAILTKSNIAPVKDFNPTSVDHLHDPSLNHLTVDERSTKAIEFHQNRLIRGLKFIRSYLRRSVARNFVNHGWITNEQAQQVISENNNGNGHSNSSTNTFETTRASSASLSNSGSSGLGEGQEHMQETNNNNEQMDIEDETYDNSLPGAGQPAPRQ
ncbi:hypothetical protein INT47_009413 [Mucor saturninus]|uniref:Uncharacterized protein n=1 Tax=Mucor saturninus TaxID=64648 RepID=A0A8H7QXS8_9FUNG|nr:hypothetical protein INT47_009413 [Mucor saturninus]